MISSVALSEDLVLKKFIIFLFIKICNLSRYIYEYAKKRTPVHTGIPTGSGQETEEMESALLKETVKMIDWLKRGVLPMLSAYLCELLCVCCFGDVTSGSAILLGINVMEYKFYRYVRRGYAADKNVRILWKQKEYYRRYLDILQKEREKNRRLRHDLKKQYLLERFYLEQGEYDLLRKEYDRVCAVVISKEVITGHVMMDAILTYERTEADRRQIALQMEVSVPADLAMMDYHLNALLGNILDNAIEYTQSGGTIWITILYDRKNLFIKCRNMPLILLPHRDASWKKDEHGIGLQIVRDVVANYNGSMEIEKTKLEYAVMIILELNYQKLH